MEITTKEEQVTSTDTIGTTIHDETVEVVRTIGGWQVKLDGRSISESPDFTKAHALERALRFVPAHRRDDFSACGCDATVSCWYCV